MRTWNGNVWARAKLVFLCVCVFVFFALFPFWRCVVREGEADEVFAANTFTACRVKDVSSFSVVCTIFEMKTHLSVPYDNLPLHLLLHVHIHILIDAHVLQPFFILPQLDQLLHLPGLKMWPQMPFKLLQYLRLRFVSSLLMP